MRTKDKKALYLDVCTFCRPFDDQSQMRICLETNAYYPILQAIRSAYYDMIVSPIHSDDRLIKQCKREQVLVSVMNPVEFAIAEDLK